MPEDYVTDLPAGTLTQNEAPTRGSFFLRLLHMALVTSSLALVFATFLPLLHPYWPLAAVAEHFALQILIAAAVLAALAFALRRWRWLSIIGGIAFIQIWTIHPYWPTFLAGPRSAIAGQAGDLKIVSLNVWHKSDAYGAVRDYLTASGADVIGLVEVTPRWKRELAPLKEIYPYSIDCQERNPRCEELLLSKHPFTKSFSGHINKALPVIASAEVAGPDGVPLTFVVTHLSWPILRSDIDGDGPTVQAEQARNLVHALQKLGPNLVLMGDFNGAPWSGVQQDLRRQTGLDSAGFLAPSWLAWGVDPMRLPIDHIMTRGKASLTALRPGPDVGSDHLPLEGIISLAQP